MTVDREQTKRDAELLLSDPEGATVIRVAEACLALLAEFEQAERTRDSLAATLQMIDDRIRNTVGSESRLAKVPALVEAVTRLLYDLDRNQSTLERSIVGTRKALTERERE